MSYEENNINLVILGHAGSGKSVLAGHFICKYGTVNKECIEEYEKELSTIEPTSSKYSWVMKKLKTERESGHSTDISLWNFRSPRHLIAIIDAPGHKNFIKNMVTGSSHADCAIIIDSAAREEFKVCVSQEYADLAFTLGIKHLIIVVNKIDTINYDEKRFQDFSNEMRHHISKVGYNPENVNFIPISGLNGDNILKLSPHTPWYKGATLLHSIDAIPLSTNPIDRPLRFSVEKVMVFEGKGIITSGKIETGIMTTDMDVSFAPSGITSKVLMIKNATDTIMQAKAGDEIGFLVEEIPLDDIDIGNIVGDSNNDPPKSASEFTALIYILNHPGKIRAGLVSTLVCDNIHVPCKFAELLEKIDPRSGQVIGRNPSNITSGDAAIVKMVPLKPMCVEVYSHYPHLGRFFIPNGESKAIFGVIKSVKSKDKKPRTSFSDRLRKRFSSR